MVEGRESSADEYLGNGRLEITAELGCLRPLRDGIVWLGRSIIPFRGWTMVPHSDPDSTSSALHQRPGEPPDAMISRESGDTNKRSQFAFRRLHRAPQ